MWRAHPENRSPQAWEDLVETLAQVLSVAEAAGVTLAIEPHKFFTRTGDNTWALNVGADDGEFSGGTAGNLRLLSSGAIAFMRSAIMRSARVTSQVRAARDSASAPGFAIRIVANAF